MAMDWDAEIENFLDANRFRGVHRKMMKRNLMRLSPEKRRIFLKKRLEDYEDAPGPAAAPPASPKAHGAVDSSNVPCEGCGGAIAGTLHYVRGEHFADGWRRGYFCSTECLDRSFAGAHYGSPHKDLSEGDVVKLMDEVYLYTADDEERCFDAGSLLRVVGGQRFYDGCYAVGEGGDLMLGWPYLVVDLVSGGEVYVNVYLGGLLFVRRG